VHRLAQELADPSPFNLAKVASGKAAPNPTTYVRLLRIFSCLLMIVHASTPITPRFNINGAGATLVIPDTSRQTLVVHSVPKMATDTRNGHR